MFRSVFLSYILFGCRTAVPLITLPFLSHTLGVAGFGVALACQSIGLLAALFVQYGFHVSASRDIGSAETYELDDIIARVLGAQGFTVLLGITVALGAFLVTSSIPKSPAILLGIMLIVFGTGMAPAWYFRGIGRNPTGMLLELIGQLLALGPIMFLVRTPEDLGLSVVLMGAGPTLTTFAGFWWLYSDRGRAALPRFSPAAGILRRGFPLFLSRASSTGFTLGAAWLAALLTTATQVAYFGAAAKLVAALSALSQPVLLTLLPNISRTAVTDRTLALRRSAKWGALIVAVAFVIVGMIQLTADFIIGLLFADDMAHAAVILRQLSILVVIVALRDTLGDLTLVPLRQDRSVAVATILGGTAFLLCSFLLAPHLGATGMAIARMFGEITNVLFMTVALLVGLGIWTRKGSA